jgi:TolB-like protein
MIYRFAKFSLDTALLELRSALGPVAVEPQVLRLLVFLIENRGHVVSKDELIDAIWDGRIVSDDTLNSRINAARRAVGDTGNAQAIIRTFPKRGFRFVAQIEAGSSMPAGGADDLRSKFPDKLCIAVLPFANLSGEPEQEHLAVGIAEDINTELSRYRWLLVIDRNTTMSFKGKPVDTKGVGRQLGVHYVVEGSVRKSGNRARITAQLIDARAGTQIWAERYDRELTDIFAVQDEITQSVTGIIQPELFAAEFNRTKGKLPESMEAWDYIVRGRWHALGLTRQDSAESQRLLRVCLERYPDYVPALAALSYSLTNDVFLGWSNDIPAWLAEARQLAERAALLDNNDAWVRCAIGVSHFTAKEPDKAVHHLRKAIELNPSFALGHGYLAVQLAFAGEAEQAIEEAEIAIRLSPRDPELFCFFVAIGTAHFVAGRFEQAAAWAEKSIRERAGVPGPRRLLATSLAHLGRVDEAREVVRRVLEITPHATVANIQRAIHFGRPKDLERYISGLRLAGLPE